MLIDKETHQAYVYVICDRFIIGTETLSHINKDHTLRHKTRLSDESYENHHGYTLHSDLVQQYSVNDLNGILLAPRSRFIGEHFMHAPCVRMG